MKNKLAKLVLVLFVLEIIALGVIFPMFGKILLGWSAALAFILPPLWAINTFLVPAKAEEYRRRYQHLIKEQSDEVDKC